MSERLYSLILRLYPRAFRDRYAAEMRQVFLGRLRDEGAMRVWLDVLGDAVISIPQQHIVREPHPYYPPSAVPLRAAEALMMRGAICSMFAGFAVALIFFLSFFVGFAKTWPLAGALLVAFGLKARKGSRAIEALRTVRAEAGSDAVTVAYAGMAPLTLRREEITGLHEFQLVGLRIQTADPLRDLWVPFRTASYEALKASLGQWVPVKSTPHFLFRIFDNLPVLAVLLYVLAVFIPLTFTGAAFYLLYAALQFFRQNAPLYWKVLVAGALGLHVARWVWLADQ
jgi:hypothetical protein